MHLVAAWCGAAIAALIAFTISTAQAQETVLRYSSWLPPSQSTNDALALWIKDVERVTEGRVTVEYLPAPVRSAREQIDVVVDGLADLVLVNPRFTPGRFPVLEGGELPLLVNTDIGKLGPVFHDFYERELAATDPFKGAHVLTTVAATPFHVTTRAKPIDSFNDLAGLKLRTSSATGSDIINAIGTVAVHSTEVYEMASAGIIDGTFFFYATMLDWKTGDILPSVTVIPGGIGQAVLAPLINQVKWESLSAADREAITGVSSAALATSLSQHWQSDEDEALEVLKRYPNFQVSQVSEAFMEEFKARLAPREVGWVERAMDGLIVFFHGGGFVLGDLETRDHVCRDLCIASGYTVMAVDYRLAPEHRFPASTDDCRAAARWAGENAEGLGCSGRIVLAGDSPGATLAAVTAIRIRDEGGPAIAGQVLTYPATYYHTPATPSCIENALGYSLTRNAMTRLWRNYVRSDAEARHTHASPLRVSDLSRLPPALIITAEFDSLHDEGNAYIERLVQAEVDFTHRHHDGMIHGFLRMAHVSTRARDEFREIAAWIRELPNVTAPKRRATGGAEL